VAEDFAEYFQVTQNSTLLGKGRRLVSDLLHDADLLRNRKYFNGFFQCVLVIKE